MKKVLVKRRFEDCLDKVVYTNKVRKRDFLEIGKYPVVSQEQDFINGYWDNSKDVFKISKPIIVFGDHTQVLKYIDFDFVLGADGVKILQPIDNLNPRYFYYCLMASNIRSLGYARHYRLLKDLEIPIFSLLQQQRIVAILDEAFAAIDKVKEKTEKNLQNVKELFENYLQSTFANKGGDWEEKTLGEIADVEYGYTDNSTIEGNYRYIRITDIDKNGKLILEDKKYVKHSKEAESFLLKDNDLLMARTGATFAKVLLYKDYEPSIFASYLIRIKFTEKIDNELYWYFAKTSYYLKQANSLSSGSAQPHFNGAALKQVIFSFPKSVREQELLIKKFEALSAITNKLEKIYQQRLNDLEELKKSILQKAFNGELAEAYA